jgi:hypothetical protein
MLRLVVATSCRRALIVGFRAGRKGAARGAEGGGEKAKRHKKGNAARGEVKIASAHLFIVRGVGEEGIVF